LEIISHLYLKYGTKLVWVLYPRLRGARVYTPDGDFWVDVDGTLDGGDVLPGLSIPLAEIFAAVGPIKKD
jgi:Uma2 family endonuclease